MGADSKQPWSRGRLRRRVGAALVAAGVVFGGAMVVSRWWWFGYSTGTRSFDIGDGTLYLASRESEESWETVRGGFEIERNNHWNGPMAQTQWGVWSWWRWGEVYVSWPAGERRWEYTVWPVAPLLVGIGAGLGYPGLVGAVRRRRNCCVRCGYSRAGLAAGAVCPECGAGV